MENDDFLLNWSYCCSHVALITLTLSKSPPLKMERVGMTHLFWFVIDSRPFHCEWPLDHRIPCILLPTAAYKYDSAKNFLGHSSIIAARACVRFNSQRVYNKSSTREVGGHLEDILGEVEPYFHLWLIPVEAQAPSVDMNWFGEGPVSIHLHIIKCQLNAGQTAANHKAALSASGGLSSLISMLHLS